MAKVECFFDGCCEPINPGGTASYGAVVVIDGREVWTCSEIFRPERGREKQTSNNVAEYSGFIAILKYLLDQGSTGSGVTIYGDSMLVIKQMQGRWRIKKGLYVPFAREAKALMEQFKHAPKLRWIPRERNDRADVLSKAELKKAGVKFKLQPED